MKRISTFAIIAVASLLSLAVQAAPVTIDFEEFNVGDSGIFLFDPLQSMGYDISGIFLGSPDPAEIVIGTNTGTKSFGGTLGGPGQDGFGLGVFVQFERSDGGAFAIHSLDLFMDTDPEGFTTISGTLAGGGAASLGVTVGTGDWLNLEYISFRAEGNQFGLGGGTVELDNVVVSAVPIPAAVWLFGSGLGLLVWFGRRQTA
jgi:hypothetical protein